MRANTRNALLAVAALGLAASVSAQGVMAVIVQEPCGTSTQLLTNNAEIYAVKHTSSPGSVTDWQVWVNSRGLFIGMAAGSANEGGFSLIDSNFASGPAVGTDLVCAYITYPDERLLATSTIFDGTANVLRQRLVQRLGDTLPAGTLNGAGLTLPGGTGTVSVNLGSGAANFPQGPEIVFGAIVQINDSDVGGCRVGGRVNNSPRTGGGCIIGYNVYRVDGDAAFMGGSGPAIRTALANPANWAYFLPYTRNNSAGMGTGFDITVGDTGGMGADAPADGTPSMDLAGLQNQVAGENGDEILVFQDTNLGRDGATARPGGIQGQDGTACPSGCWYAIQAVVDGSPMQFAAGTVDMDMDGTADAIDFDMDGTNEFISPQADFNIPGLGLTHGGQIHLSKVVWSDGATLATRRGFELAADLVGGKVSLALSAPVEDTSILGYNVYRIAAGERARVNDQIIAARGGDGNVYRLEDEVVSTSRRIRRGDAQYEVEIVFNDGSASETIGPFDITSNSEQRSRRR